MKTKIFVIFTLLIIIEGFLSGCTETNNGLSSEEERFVGTWEAYSENFQMTILLIFEADRTFTQEPIVAQWRIRDGRLVISGENLPESQYDYYFTDEDTVLYIRTVGAPSDTYISYNKMLE
jgi:hypothetical protein